MFEETPMSKILKEKFPSVLSFEDRKLREFLRKCFIDHLKEEIDLALEQKDEEKFLLLTSYLSRA